MTAPLDAAPLLRAQGLVKVLGGKRVLDELSLEVPDGQLLVVLGPSGSGKSMMLKHLIGILRPDEGHVLVEGKDLWALDDRGRDEVRRRVGFAFQEGALFDSLDVFENVAFPLRRHSALPEREIAARVRECLSQVRLWQVERRRPSELSTGMRRRVGFARAIALKPRLLLFDEPTAGLDPVMVTVMGQLIAELRESLKATCLLVTHDLALARSVGERVALLVAGRLVADAPMEQFFRLEDPRVRQMVEGRAEGPLLEHHEDARTTSAPAQEAAR